MILLSSCKKDSNPTPKSDVASEEFTSGEIGLRSGGSNKSTSQSTLPNFPSTTVLGSIRANPYSVANMLAAYNELYEPDISNLNTTHQYIKFSPQNDAELDLLVRSNFEIYDYPLDYEVITMGEYYRDPAVAANIPSFHYAVIPIGRTLPAVSYTTLANLHLFSADENLIRQALIRLGYDPDQEGYVVSTDGWDPNAGQDPNSDAENAPPPAALEPIVVNGNCNCKNGLPSIRNPAGCIRVIDTQLSTFGNCETYKGVRHVKVILKDSWFSEVEYWTNKYGCFSSANRKFKNKCWMWVKFYNNNINIRYIQKDISAAIDWKYIVKDYVGVKWGPNFNNLDVCYNNSNDIESNGHRYWRSAHINNALFEYRDWASSRGVTLPFNDVDVISTNYASSGAAPCLSKLSGSAVTAPIAFGITIQIPIIFAPVKPDVVINRNTSSRNTSDNLKELCYHEFAHVSHFERLSTPNYWLANINYIIANNGYGDGTATGAGRCATIEMWAYHCGPTCADKAYGTKHSNGVPATSRRWIGFQERTVMEWGFFPSEALTDIIDDNAFSPAAEPIGLLGVPIIDLVDGYTEGQMLTALSPNVTTPFAFRNAFLLASVPAGSPTTNYITLMSHYGL